jgi:hypothetical protein
MTHHVLTAFSEPSVTAAIGQASPFQTFQPSKSLILSNGSPKLAPQRGRLIEVLTFFFKRIPG